MRKITFTFKRNLRYLPETCLICMQDFCQIEFTWFGKEIELPIQNEQKHQMYGTIEYQQVQFGTIGNIWYHWLPFVTNGDYW